MNMADLPKLGCSKSNLALYGMLLHASMHYSYSYVVTRISCFCCWVTKDPPGVRLGLRLELGLVRSSVVGGGYFLTFFNLWLLVSDKPAWNVKLNSNSVHSLSYEACTYS